MKNVLSLWSCVLLSCVAWMACATTLMAAPPAEPQPAVQDVEASTVGQQAMVDVAADLHVEAAEPTDAVQSLQTPEGDACQATAAGFPGPNHCGDPCSNEGETVGCVDTSGPQWVRTFCTCSNGTLVC